MQDKQNIMGKVSFKLVGLVLLATGITWVMPAYAHHVLGRPAYSLNEDSNTPPSMEIETQIGKYYVTMMAFPAFPKPGQRGRVNLYAVRIDDGESYDGSVTFTVREDSWFGGEQEMLGTQPPDDRVYRQGFSFHKAGNYIIRAEFESDGEPYQLDFPVRIGSPVPIGPIGVTVGSLAVLLIGVNIFQRRRLQRLRASQYHAGKPSSSDPF